MECHLLSAKEVVACLNGSNGIDQLEESWHKPSLQQDLLVLTTNEEVDSPSFSASGIFVPNCSILLSLSLLLLHQTALLMDSQHFSLDGLIIALVVLHFFNPFGLFQFFQFSQETVHFFHGRTLLL
jgi:hypothetical protein